MGALTCDDVLRYVAGRCLAPGGGGRVGVEVEWFAHGLGHPPARVPLETLQPVVDTIGRLPGGARITYEPGGQVELSGPPHEGPAAACAAMNTDILVLRPRLAAAGVSLFAAGLHPAWAPERLLCAPRYDAMEAYFDRAAEAGGAPAPSWGSPGRTMMTLTGAVQVNVDLGPDPERTWGLAHDLGPVFVAAFANSPLAGGGPTGFRSTRFANWWCLDPGRTRPIGGAGDHRAGTGTAAAAAVADYALAAGLMGIRDDDGGFEPVLNGLTFGGWLRDGHEGRYPTSDDLGYHLTTLFPPVRPRGWLELRMIDALPSPWWQVPVAVAAALLSADTMGDAAADDRGARAAAGLWLEAARDGLTHPTVASASRRAFELAVHALEASPADRPLAPVVRAYADRYVFRGLCPADDLLDAWRTNGGALLGAEVEAAS